MKWTIPTFEATSVLTPKIELKFENLPSWLNSLIGPLEGYDVNYPDQYLTLLLTTPTLKYCARELRNQSQTEPTSVVVFVAMKDKSVIVKSTLGWSNIIDWWSWFYTAVAQKEANGLLKQVIGTSISGY